MHVIYFKVHVCMLHGISSRCSLGFACSFNPHFYSFFSAKKGVPDGDSDNSDTEFDPEAYRQFLRMSGRGAAPPGDKKSSKKKDEKKEKSATGGSGLTASSVKPKRELAPVKPIASQAAQKSANAAPVQKTAAKPTL